LSVFKFIFITICCVAGAIFLVLAITCMPFIVAVIVAGVLNHGDVYGKVEYIGESYSPNKQLKVVEYLYLGGGAIGFCNRNLIIQRDDEIKPTPSAFPKTVFSAKCGVDVAVSWVNDEEVIITYLTKEMLEPNVKLNPKHTYSSISIEYEHDI
jgi:hypothetical protein